MRYLAGSGDPYGYLAFSGVPAPPSVDIAELVRESGADERHGGVLPEPFASRAVCGLTQQADRWVETTAVQASTSA